MTNFCNLSSGSRRDFGIGDEEKGDGKVLDRSTSRSFSLPYLLLVLQFSSLIIEYLHTTTQIPPEVQPHVFLVKKQLSKLMPALPVNNCSP
jgi:hypothetical protein